MYFLSFDSYYKYDMYNSFVATAIKNGLNLRQYIHVNTLRWYISLQYQSDFPKFLKYDILTDRRYLLEVITPISDAERIYLERRSATISNIEKFVSPKCFREAKTKPTLIFKYRDIALLKRFTNLSDKYIIYLLGRQQNKQKLALTFAIDIKKFINSTDIMVEGLYSKPYELELKLNNLYLLPRYGLTNKMIHYPYVKDGSTFIPTYPTGFF